MPGAEWFPGARLNYAEHVLGTDEDARPGGGRRALADARPDRADLRRAARARRAGARGPAAAGRRPGRPRRRLPAQHPRDARRLHRHRQPRRDRGRRCAPEFGARSVLARFGQIEPKVLLAVGGYTYRDRPIDRREQVAEIRAGLPTLEHVVHVPYGPNELPDAIGWDDLLAEPAELAFEPVAFDHPVYVLFSSGTTGLPKAIVHGHGGQLVEHLKGVGLGWDLKPGGRLLWFSTTAWMMWNALVSALLVRASIVMIDGDPMWPDPSFQWRLAQETRPTLHGRRPDVPHGLPQGGPAARPRLRPLEHPRPGLRRVAAAERGLPLRLRAVRPRHPVPQRQRRHRHLRRVRLGQLPAARLRRRDLRLLPGRRRQGLRRRRRRGRGRARRDGGHRADALDAGALLERRRRRALPLRLLRPLPGRLAPGRLDPLHRARKLRHHRALRRDAQPRRRAHGHQRALRRRRGALRGRRQPDRAPRGRRGRRGRADPLRRAGRRSASSTTRCARGSRARCAQSSRRATCPTRSSPCRRCRAR